MVGLVLAASCLAASSAAADTKIPRVHYQQAEILEDYLPYAKKFHLVGSTASHHGRADAVALEITGEFLGGNGTSTANFLWLRPSQSDATAPDSFEIFVGKRLKLDRNYRLEIFFLQKFDVEVVPIVRAMTRRLALLEDLSDPSAVLAQIEREASVAAQHTLQNAVRGEAIRHLDLEGKLSVRDGPPLFALNDETSAALLNAVASIQATQEAALEEEEARNSLAAAQDSLIDSGVFDLIEASTQGDLKEEEREDLPYDTKDVAALLRAITDGQPSHLSGEEKTHEDLRSALKNLTFTKKVLTTAREQDILQRYLDAAGTVRTAEETIGRLKAAIQTARAEAVAVCKRFVETQYVPLSRVTLTHEAWPGQTELRKLKLGLSYTIGGAALALGSTVTQPGEAPRGESDSAVFSGVLMRYHPIGQVDKSLPAALAYSSRKARFSVDVGFVFKSDLEYQGVKMADALGSLKPMFGAGFDVTPDIAFHGGVVLFRQPSVSPLTTDASDVKVGYYLSLGYDFNVFNWIRDQLPKSDKS